MLQCVAVCCSVLQCVAVCSLASAMVVNKSQPMLLCVAVCCDVLQLLTSLGHVLEYGLFYLLQCVALCCSVLQSVAVCSLASAMVTNKG